MNVGISIFASKNVNIWNNGINQNIAFLVMAMRKIPMVKKVFLINGGDADEMPKDLCFEGLDVELVRQDQVTHEVDYVIEMGASLSQDWVQHVKALGARVACFQVGQPYVGPAEVVLFGKKEGGAPFQGLVDEIWLLPQYMHSGAAMGRTMARCEVLPMPHIWAPYFLDEALKLRADRDRFGYSTANGANGKRAWRAAIFEPNISVAKNCFVPMLICEQVQRTRPEAIGLMMALNTFHMKDHLTFNRFAIHLDITRAGKATYEPRLAFLDVMLGHSVDAVVSHQWENAQNYVYYEALYGGYPLIHNSPYLQKAGMGFYYADFEAAEGGRQFAQAWDLPAEYWGEYRRNAANYLKTVSPEAPENLAAFAQRLALGARA